jgi:hypothetical protein
MLEKPTYDELLQKIRELESTVSEYHYVCTFVVIVN